MRNLIETATEIKNVKSFLNANGIGKLFREFSNSELDSAKSLLQINEFEKNVNGYLQTVISVYSNNIFVGGAYYLNGKFERNCETEQDAEWYITDVKFAELTDKQYNDLVSYVKENVINTKDSDGKYLISPRIRYELSNVINVNVNTYTEQECKDFVLKTIEYLNN